MEITKLDKQVTKQYTNESQEKMREKKGVMCHFPRVLTTKTNISRICFASIKMYDYFFPNLIFAEAKLRKQSNQKQQLAVKGILKFARQHQFEPTSCARVKSFIPSNVPWRKARDIVMDLQNVGFLYPPKTLSLSLIS